MKRNTAASVWRLDGFKGRFRASDKPLYVDRAQLTPLRVPLLRHVRSWLLERDNHLETFMIARLSVISHLGGAFGGSTETVQ
jgi:hypothetical protein